MQKYRRSKYVIFTLEDLSTSSEGPTSTQWIATALLSGQHLLVTVEQLAALQQVSSSDWVSAAELGALGYSQAKLDELSALAILLIDGSSSGATYLDRENQLDDGHWPPMAAAFHLLNSYQESSKVSFGKLTDTASSEKEADDRARRFIEISGPAPSANFIHPAAAEPVPLDRVAEVDEVARTLWRRRTCRQFVPEAVLARRDLSRLLRLVFGPTAVRKLAGQLDLFLKTSPSGGSLHPIEGFPLLFRSEEDQSGLYHYRADRHGLALIRAIPEDRARQLATYFAQGQSFVGTCSAIVVLVARFDRNFWKYRRRENSYMVVMQDAGHLAQTFQLVATELGLSTFYTAAINGEAIAEALNLRYPNQSAIGILGIGRGAADCSHSVEIESWEPPS